MGLGRLRGNSDVRAVARSLEANREPDAARHSVMEGPAEFVVDRPIPEVTMLAEGGGAGRVAGLGHRQQG